MTYSSPPPFSAQQCREFILQLLPLAPERFGIECTIESLAPPIGGWMDGKHFVLSESLFEHDPEYALYALIHAGFGHNYQLGDEAHPIYSTYAVLPEHQPGESLIRKIRAVEAEATSYGLAIIKELIPDSLLATHAEHFVCHWFAQDWRLLEKYFQGGKYPQYGIRFDLTADEMQPLPDVALRLDFWAELSPLPMPIPFHAVATNGNGHALHQKPKAPEQGL